MSCAFSAVLDDGIDIKLSTDNDINKIISKQFPKIYRCAATDVPRGVVLSIPDEMIFEKNSLKISDNGKKILNKIVFILNAITNNCTIEGHSIGSVKISDWEYSMIKADTVSDYIIKQDKKLQERIFALGLGDNEPEDTNNCIVSNTEDRINFVFMEYEFNR